MSMTIVVFEVVVVVGEITLRSKTRTQTVTTPTTARNIPHPVTILKA